VYLEEGAVVVGGNPVISFAGANEEDEAFNNYYTNEE
jgi:hypothetical protein